MAEGSQVSKVTLCVKILNWHWVTQWPRSGIELPGQLKKVETTFLFIKCSCWRNNARDCLLGGASPLQKPHVFIRCFEFLPRINGRGRKSTSLSSNLYTLTHHHILSYFTMPVVISNSTTMSGACGLLNELRKARISSYSHLSHQSFL